jgi:hypothetical protein
MIVIKIISIVLLADFIAGIIHWWEDAYGNPNWKYIGKSIVQPNLEHHQYPRKFLKNSFWISVKISVISGTIICVILFSFNFINLTLGAGVMLASLGNEFHAMAHRTDKENGKIVVYLQKIGLIQCRKMHGHHHKSPYNFNYCIMTNYLNPILNTIHFWTILEKNISYSRIKPTRGSIERNGY